MVHKLETHENKVLSKVYERENDEVVREKMRVVHGEQLVI
jgi:hypothetical protein